MEDITYTIDFAMTSARSLPIYILSYVKGMCETNVFHVPSMDMRERYQEQRLSLAITEVSTARLLYHIPCSKTNPVFTVSMTTLSNHGMSRQLLNSFSKIFPLFCAQGKKRMP